MKQSGFTIIYLVLLAAQIILCNFFNFSQYFMISFLPAMILCLPVRRNVFFALLLAFATGFLADFLSDGMLGLTVFSLVPVAFLRFPILRLVFGEELFSRGDNLSFVRQGMGKIMLCVVLATAVFLLLYIWADGAGTRPFWFNAVKFTLSLLASTMISGFVARIFCYDSQWR